MKTFAAALLGAYAQAVSVESIGLGGPGLRAVTVGRPVTVVD